MGIWPNCVLTRNPILAAEEVINQTTALMREIEKAENEMKSLKSGVSNSAAVDLFLKRCIVAMGGKEMAVKKKKTSNNFNSTSKTKKKLVELIDLANKKTVIVRVAARIIVIVRIATTRASQRMPRRR